MKSATINSGLACGAIVKILEAKCALVKVTSRNISLCFSTFFPTPVGNAILLAQYSITIKRNKKWVPHVGKSVFFYFGYTCDADSGMMQVDNCTDYNRAYTLSMSLSKKQKLRYSTTVDKPPVQTPTPIPKFSPAVDGLVEKRRLYIPATSNSITMPTNVGFSPQANTTPLAVTGLTEVTPFDTATDTPLNSKVAGKHKRGTCSDPPTPVPFNLSVTKECSGIQHKRIDECAEYSKNGKLFCHEKWSHLCAWQSKCCSLWATQKLDRCNKCEIAYRNIRKDRYPKLFYQEVSPATKLSRQSASSRFPFKLLLPNLLKIQARNLAEKLKVKSRLVGRLNKKLHNVETRYGLNVDDVEGGKFLQRIFGWTSAHKVQAIKTIVTSLLTIPADYVEELEEAKEASSKAAATEFAEQLFSENEYHLQREFYK